MFQNWLIFMAARLPDYLLLLLKQLECSGFTVRKSTLQFYPLQRLLRTQTSLYFHVDLSLGTGIHFVPNDYLTDGAVPTSSHFFILTKLFKQHRVSLFNIFSGLENICVDIECALGRKTGIYWRFCWSIFTPIIMIVVFMYAMITTDNYKFGGYYVYPNEAYSKYLQISRYLHDFLQPPHVYTMYCLIICRPIEFWEI